MVTLRKSDPLKLLGKRLLILALLFLVASSVWGVWNVYLKNADAARLKQEAQAQFADLSAREAKMQGDLDALQTSRGMESVLRDNYNVGESGENMIVIVEPQEPSATSTSNSNSSWFQKVFSW